MIEFLLTGALVLAVVTGAAFATLWYLGREPLRQRTLEYEAKLQDLEQSRDQVISEAWTKARRITEDAEARKRMAQEEAQAIRDRIEAERSGLDRERAAMAKAARDELREQRARIKETREKLAADKERLSIDRASMESLWRSRLDELEGERGAIIESANAEARSIAGDALDAKRNAEKYSQTASAMKNLIDGYGDQYIRPIESLLDDLAEEFDHKEAGRELKSARDRTRRLITEGRAATCEYVEPSRREGAERFVLDAFNGKVDSVLSTVRHDNYGTLEQRIHDAFALVNHGGEAFRNARVTRAYLDARLTELRWAVIAQELKRQEQEEQRRIREQIREEEKARRDFERAQREAEREEMLLRKAMQDAQSQLAIATAEQKEQYESQLAELSDRLRQAEEKGQRAISMAQQTKRGHVYVISNVGSFGQDIVKIGLTRRLEPMDRVRELGDASVPFEFDVHAVIWSEDAPALETRLHKHFLLAQVNKVNHRKEFFRTSVGDIRRELESLGIDAHWTMVAEAREYRETVAIERAITSDPAARQQWLDRQLTLDPVNHDELSSPGEPFE